MKPICVLEVVNLGFDNGLTFIWRRGITWANDELFLIGSLGTYFGEILVEIQTLPQKKMPLKKTCKMSAMLCSSGVTRGILCSSWQFFIKLSLPQQHCIILLEMWTGPVQFSWIIFRALCHTQNRHFCIRQHWCWRTFRLRFPNTNHLSI